MTARRGERIGSAGRGHFPSGVSGAAGAASNAIMAFASFVLASVVSSAYARMRVQGGGVFLLLSEPRLESGNLQEQDVAGIGGGRLRQIRNRLARAAGRLVGREEESSQLGCHLTVFRIGLEHLFVKGLRLFELCPRYGERQEFSYPRRGWWPSEPDAPASAWLLSAGMHSLARRARMIRTPRCRCFRVSFHPPVA